MNAPTQPRQRPFGVIVVGLLQLGTVAVAIAGSVAHITLPWEGTFAQLFTEASFRRDLTLLMLRTSLFLALVAAAILR